MAEAGSKLGKCRMSDCGWRMWDVRTSAIRHFPASEEVLQGKLHDPGILRRRDLPKRIAVERCGRIVHPEPVCDIERFSAKFDLLHFLNLKCSRQREIELPAAGPCHA